jgi:cytochrome P450
VLRLQADKEHRFDHTRWLKGSQSQNVSPDPETMKSIYTPFGAGSRFCMGVHLARMELRLAAAEFFTRCQGARLAPSTTPESMEMENFFLIAPKSHECEVIIP